MCRGEEVRPSGLEILIYSSHFVEEQLGAIVGFEPGVPVSLAPGSDTQLCRWTCSAGNRTMEMLGGDVWRTDHAARIRTALEKLLATDFGISNEVDDADPELKIDLRVYMGVVGHPSGTHAARLEWRSGRLSDASADVRTLLLEIRDEIRAI